MAESLLLALVGDFINEGDIAVDIGAGVYPGGADYTSQLLKCVGDSGKVYAFDAFSLDLPEKPNLIQVKMPVWSKSGKFKPEILFPWGIPMAMSTGTTPEPKNEYEAVSLDDYFPTEKIAFMKMDIEGGEAQALLGAKNIIDRNPDFKMVLECHWSYLPMFLSTQGKIWQFLTERGLTVYRINDLFVPVEKEEDFNIRLGSHVFLARKGFIESRYHFEREGDHVVGYRK